MDNGSNRIWSNLKRSRQAIRSHLIWEINTINILLPLITHWKILTRLSRRWLPQERNHSVRWATMFLLQYCQKNHTGYLNYFKQMFAQVTNPPIDPIREELVMTLSGYLGSLQQNLLETTPDHVKLVRFRNPVIANTYFQIVKNLRYKGFSAANLQLHFDAGKGAEGLKDAVEQLCKDAEKAVDEGKNYIILSDRGIDQNNAPIPSLLAVSAVHHYLIKRRKRMQIDIVVESAEPR